MRAFRCFRAIATALVCWTLLDTWTVTGGIDDRDPPVTRGPASPPAGDTGTTDPQAKLRLADRTATEAVPVRTLRKLGASEGKMDALEYSQAAVDIAKPEGPVGSGGDDDMVAGGCVADYTVTAPYTSPSRFTCGTFDDCSVPAPDSVDHIYRVTIPTAGAWTFSLCGASYDTRLRVGTTCCGNQVGDNDDSCGLASELTRTISAGTYYVVVDGYDGDCGEYRLAITGGGGGACVWDWCGTGFHEYCHYQWRGDGECDCGCQYCDTDCSDCTGQGCGAECYANVYADSYSENWLQVPFCFYPDPGSVAISRSPACGSVTVPANRVWDPSFGCYQVSTRFTPCETEGATVTITADPTSGANQTKTICLDPRIDISSGEADLECVATYDAITGLPAAADVVVSVIPSSAGSVDPSSGRSAWADSCQCYIFCSTYTAGAYRGRVRVKFLVPNAPGTSDDSWLIFSYDQNEGCTPPCDDGVFCNGLETCVAGTCVPGTNPCQASCTSPGTNDGDCTGCCNEALDNCTAPEPGGSPCNDNQYCNGTDTCNSTGSCANHTGDPCPCDLPDADCTDCCNEALDNCTAPEPNGSPCNDNLYCNGADTCNNGSCSVHSGDPCPCDLPDADCTDCCNEALDNCTAPEPNGSPCNDGLFCNGADTCSGGMCGLHAGNPCSGPPDDFCDETYGVCRFFGNADWDSDVDLADFWAFQFCFSGAGEEAFWLCRAMFDSDRDGDVDLSDYVRFYNSITGP